MNNVKVAFKFIDNGSKLPIIFNKITYHLKFDVRFDLTRKAKYIDRGHLTQVPSSMSYSSVVSRKPFRIMFLIASFNGLNIKMRNIGNAYLNTDTMDRLWFTSGFE